MQPKNKKISFLLGSGFSVPDGVRTVGEINAKIQKLKLEDIYIHSDLTFILLNGQKKPEYSMQHFEEKFFIEFIKFYVDLSGKPFDYEEFYDFIMSYIYFSSHKNEVDDFVNAFNQQIQTDFFKQDAINNLSKFSEYFSKMISSLLQSKKYYENVGLGNYPPYDSFINYLKNSIVVWLHCYCSFLKSRFAF